jgi:hypothetical protein
LKKLQEIIEYIDHINAHSSRVCDKRWLQEELSHLEREIYIEGVKPLKDVTSEQLNQYVNYIHTLENALKAIKGEAKASDDQIIIDIVESALEYGKPE